MSFPSVPQVSKKTVNRAGKILVESEIGSAEYSMATDVVNAWRVCHAYPINTFVATLRLKTKKYPNSLVAQRLKRMQAIVFKLKRRGNEHMKLSQMQDIGGVRAILDSIPQVRALQKEYTETGRFSHELIEVNDYISEPKKDGYRSVHLVFKYNNTLDRTGRAAQYKGLRVELQIRTKWQHQWATAVETVGMMRGEALKSMQGDKKWRELFKFVSSAFAIAEDAPVMEEHQDMTTREIMDMAARLANELNAVDVVSNWSRAVSVIDRHRSELKAHFLLVELDTKLQRVTIKGFPRSQVENANSEYSKLEKQYEKDDSKNIVMVSIGSINSLRLAYPNYFLDTQDFLGKLRDIIETSKG